MAAAAGEVIADQQGLTFDDFVLIRDFIFSKSKDLALLPQDDEDAYTRAVITEFKAFLKSKDKEFSEEKIELIPRQITIGLELLSSGFFSKTGMPEDSHTAARLSAEGLEAYKRVLANKGSYTVEEKKILLLLLLLAENEMHFLEIPNVTTYNALVSLVMLLFGNIKIFAAAFEDLDKLELFLAMYFAKIKRQSFEMFMEFFQLFKDDKQAANVARFTKDSKQLELLIKEKKKFKAFLALLDILDFTLKFDVSKRENKLTTLYEQILKQYADPIPPEWQARIDALAGDTTENTKARKEIRAALEAFQKVWNKDSSGFEEVSAALFLFAEKFIAKIAPEGVSAAQVAELIRIGTTTQDILKLDEFQKAQQAAAKSTHLPNTILEAEKYFVCKLSANDIRGLFLGLMTGCCQHLGGAGRTAAIYGYTNPNSCFYVLFKGKPNRKPDGSIDTTEVSSGNIVAQALAWFNPERPDTIIFDSLEMECQDTADSKKRQEAVKQIYMRLAEQAVKANPEVKQVLIGECMNLGAYGIPLDFFPERLEPVKPAKGVYSDASPENQMCLFNSAEPEMCRAWFDHSLCKDLPLTKAKYMFLYCAKQKPPSIELATALLKAHPEIFADPDTKIIDNLKHTLKLGPEAFLKSIRTVSPSAEAVFQYLQQGYIFFPDNHKDETFKLFLKQRFPHFTDVFIQDAIRELHKTFKEYKARQQENSLFIELMIANPNFSEIWSKLCEQHGSASNLILDIVKNSEEDTFLKLLQWGEFNPDWLQSDADDSFLHFAVQHGKFKVAIAIFEKFANTDLLKRLTNAIDPDTIAGLEGAKNSGIIPSDIWDQFIELYNANRSKPGITR